MSRLAVDLFAEDRAHEEFLRSLILRIGRAENSPLSLRVRAARGGHPLVLQALRAYRSAIENRGLGCPDVLVVGIDANCSRYGPARAAIVEVLGPALESCAAVACADPHVERWYLADPDSFEEVVGVRPRAERRKCKRDRYKQLLLNAVQKGGHETLLGGIEFASDLVEAMDLFRAGRTEASLKHFISEFQSQLRRLR